MKKDPRIFLDHFRVYSIKTYIAGQKYSRFKRSFHLQDSLIQRLERPLMHANHLDYRSMRPFRILVEDLFLLSPHYVTLIWKKLA